MQFITISNIDKSNYKDYIGKKVNVYGDVNLSNLNLKEIPIIFGKVTGNFDCSFNELANLTNCPETVEKNFLCGFNKLVSFKNCPKYIGKDFTFPGNDRIYMDDFPIHVGGNIIRTLDWVTSTTRHLPLPNIWVGDTNK